MLPTLKIVEEIPCLAFLMNTTALLLLLCVCVVMCVLSHVSVSNVLIIINPLFLFDGIILNDMSSSP